ncbi:MAG: hypothetical protein FWG91_08320 [Lachnospiraceae bacterium]|nr:hypothetical protein [Lachnospiraceae bacterium]
MKLVYKGFFKDNSQLPVGVLPKNAVKFKAPDTLYKQIAVSVITFIPACLLVALFVLGAYLLHGDISTVGFNGWGSMLPCPRPRVVVIFFCAII